MNPKFVYFGTPDFSTFVLDELKSAGYIPTLIVTSPDRPFGRKQVLTPTPVKVWALENKIEIAQPEKLRDSSFIKRLADLNCDFFILAAYGYIIPKAILEVSNKGILNVHPSLLPKYRGPTPVQSAILNDEKETGVSIILLDEEMDHGPIVDQKKVEIDSANKTMLDEKLWHLGGKMLNNIIPKLLNNEINLVEQDHTKATHTKKYTSADAFIPSELILNSGSNSEEAREAERKVRALNPEPGTWTQIDDKRVKILSAHIEENKLIPDEIIPAGKNKTTWTQFLNTLK